MAIFNKLPEITILSPPDLAPLSSTTAAAPGPCARERAAAAAAAAPAETSRGAARCFAAARAEGNGSEGQAKMMVLHGLSFKKLGFKKNI